MVCRTGLLFLVALLLAGCATPSTQAPVFTPAEIAAEEAIQRALALEQHARQRRRLLSIGTELLIAAAQLCEGDTVNSMGIFLDGPRTYPEPMQEFAAAHLQLEPDEFMVDALAPGTPARLSKLRAGDVLLKLNGTPFSRRGAQETAPLPTAKAGTNELVVERDGQQLEVLVNSTKMCNYALTLDNVGVINAFADADSVIVNTGLLEAFDDRLVRQIVAHEIAHIVQQHLKLSMLFQAKAFEAEADYVGLYIYARAGYPVEDALPLWREMATKVRSSVFPGSGPVLFDTHPSPPERFVSMGKAIAEIRAKQATNEELLPNYRN